MAAATAEHVIMTLKNAATLYKENAYSNRKK